MLNYSEKFWIFYNELIKLEPKFKIKYKSESLFMKILGWLMFFNPTFMTGFITTIGKTVYFPHPDKLKNQSGFHYIGTLAHEFRHVYDNKKWSIGFPLIYMLPQILAILSLFSILAIWFSLSWLLCLSFLLFLTPIPSPGRKLIEFNGYTMSLFMYNEFMKNSEINEETRKEKLLISAEQYDKHFTDASYYFMWPFRVVTSFEDKIEKILSREIIKEDVIYENMIAAFNKTK